MNVRTKPIQPSHSLLWWSGLFVAAAFGVAGYLTNFIAEGIIACVIVLFGILFFRDRHTRSKLGAALRNIENSTTDGMLIDIAERRQAEEKKMRTRPRSTVSSSRVSLASSSPMRPGDLSTSIHVLLRRSGMRARQTSSANR
jgi:hypothetical protein